jgi:hypothetical protein
MSIVFWFIILPLAIALLPYVLAAIGFIVKMWVDMKEEQEADDLREARRRAAEAIADERETLRDMRLAELQNRVVLGDINVEIMKLKQEQLAQRLGKNAEPFDPANYNPEA